MSAMTVDAPTPTAYSQHALASPELSAELRPFFERFSVLYEAKLYYQLTATLQTFLTIPSSAPYQIELYNHFVESFAGKLNQLRLVEIGVAVGRQYSDGQTALAFLQKLREKVQTPLTQEAYLLASMEVSHFQLLLGDLAAAKTIIDEGEKIVEALDSVELVVSAALYRVAGDYYKAKAEYGNYYKNSLLYLACVNVATDLTAPERVSRAHDLSLSALLGNIYNFGELLMHPILEALVATEHEWIKDLLHAFNSGDIAKFESLVPFLSREPILQTSYAFLRQKICLMALIESVFKRPTSDRKIPFSIIAQETKLPADEVEHLVMKALSLRLLRGTLDQVSSTCQISWVQPRVLDLKQIGGLRERLADWGTSVGAVGAGLKGVTV